MNHALLPATNKSADAETGLDGQILTVGEVAQFLRVPKSTVYKLARLGQIPASKIGKHWRFLRKDLQAWMHHRSNGQ
jgi:excisionase family DNA binding protein